tara:strand:- start:7715 stop:8902 length:1188 start_codon:yes stop_codon:yes gene_type:complete
MKFPLMKNNILDTDLSPVISLLKEKDPKLTSGPNVKKFEDLWSEWLGVKYSVFINSGSSANLLCLALLKEKFPNGGDVIVPPFTWSSDISSIIWMGFNPKFIDISLSTLGLNSDLVIQELKKNKNIRAIFLTHAQGINGLDDKLLNYVKANNIYLIEDVCESHGVVLETGEKAGAVGDVSCFSFYYAHHMSTIEGGMVCTNDESTYESLRMLRSHGMVREMHNENHKQKWINDYQDLNEKFIFTKPAFNFRNNEIGALIGIEQLKRLDIMIKKRAENFEYFLDLLPDWCFKGFNLKGQSNYAFNVILNEPNQQLMNKLEKKLEENGIEYRRGSAGGGNQMRQPYVRKIYNFTEKDFKEISPVTDHVHFYGMYLGNYPELTFKSIDEIAAIISSVE